MKKIILSLLIALTATIGANAQTQTYDFIMPAYDVELTTELWYKLSETATDNQVNYGTKTDVYLERTLWRVAGTPSALRLVSPRRR